MTATSVGLKAGSLKPPASDPECEELKQTRDDEDDTIKKDVTGKKTQRKKKESTQRYKARAKRKKQAAADAHKATTVSSMMAKCGRKTIRKSAYSSHSNLSSKNQKRLSKGISPGEKSNLCTPKGAKPFKHAMRGYKSSCSHTEGKFIEDLFKKPPAGFANNDSRVNCSMTLSIKWKQRTRSASGGWKEADPLEVACPDCEKTICRAMDCGLKVKICTTQEDGSIKAQKPAYCDGY